MRHINNKQIDMYNKDYNIFHAFILMAIIVPFAGELNIYPFNDSFRISFGMPAFFFSLLLWPRNNSVVSGIIVGITVVGFRMFIDIPISDITSSFIRHYPTFFYYLSFGLLFHLMRMKKIMHIPVLVGFLGVLLDILASSAELAVQFIAFDSYTHFADLHKVSVIAIFRSFFTVGTYNLITLHNTRIKKNQIEQENEKLIMLITDLYEESTNLHKTLINSENVTEKSYNLYRTLKDNELQNKTGHTLEKLSKTALEIAGESHEIKKDNQRILSGLSRLISDESSSEYEPIHHIINLAIRSNGKYATTLGKDISFTYGIQGEHPKYHLYITLSIINNLLANAVEAMNQQGLIKIHITSMQNNLVIQIIDNGPGVKSKNIDIIFEPGFTTKYDTYGSASTGIGLSYVQSLVTNLHGIITLQNNDDLLGVTFSITLPKENLTARKES